MQRTGQNAKPGIDDHTEGPLGPAEHAIGADTSAGAGKPQGLPEADGRQGANGLGQVLDVGPERGEMPGGAGGEPAAESGVLKGLGKVTQGQPMRCQLGLQGRPADAGLNASGARDGIDIEQAIEPAKVKRNGTVAINGDLRPYAADDAGAPTEGDGGDALGGAPLEQALDLGVGTRAGDEVGGMREAPAKAEDDLGVGLAQSMRGAGMDIVEAEPGKRSGDWHAGRREPHLLERQRVLDLEPPEAEVLGHTGGGGTQLKGTGLLVGKPPAPVLVRAVGHEFRVYAH